MADFKHKPGTGSLFKNQYKTKELHPDFNGKIILSKSYQAGDELKIAGWKKSSAKGSFLSLSENTYEPHKVSNDVNVLEDI